MKKLLLLILPIFVFGFLACSSDDNSDEEPTAAATLKMKINGVQWVANQFAVIGQAQDEEGGYGLSIAGMATDGSRLSGSFSPGTGEVEPGTYTCGYHLLDGGAVYEGGGNVYMGGFVSETALFTFVVTDVQGSGVSRKFKGTFSGTMLGSDGAIIQITDGQFSNY